MANDLEEVRGSVMALLRFVQFIDADLKRGVDGITLNSYEADLLIHRLSVALSYMEDSLDD